MKTIPGRSEIHQAPKVSLNTFDDCVQELLEPICVIVRKATPVKKLPIIDKWAKELKKTWTQALTNFAPALDSAIEAWVTKGDDKALVAATMAYVALPGRVLVDSSRLKAANGPLILHLPDGVTKTVQVGDPHCEKYIFCDIRMSSGCSGCQHPDVANIRMRMPYPDVRIRMSTRMSSPGIL